MSDYVFLNANQAFENLYRVINNQPEVSENGTKKRRNISFRILKPMDNVITNPERKFKQSYAEYEWEWYLSGDRDAKEISERAKIWKDMFVDGTTEVNSNYGYFWNLNDQLQRVISELKANPLSRRAIVVHYDVHELDRYKYDTPCNVVLNFYVESDSLHMTIFARSMDLWFGFGNDQYTFSKLQQLVARDIDAKVGSSHYFVTDLHIYERHFGKKV